jgi:hypothetical protein
MVEGGDEENLPDTLDLTLGEIDKYWGHWLLWRATGRRVDYDHALSNFPKALWDVFFLLDKLLGIIEKQKLKQEQEQDQTSDG